MLDLNGERMPPHFAEPNSYDVELDASLSRSQRIERQRQSVRKLAAHASDLDKTHIRILDDLESSDIDVEETRVRLWDDVYRVYKDMAELGDSWNDLASDLGQKDEQ